MRSSEGRLTGDAQQNSINKIKPKLNRIEEKGGEEEEEERRRKIEEDQ